MLLLIVLLTTIACFSYFLLANWTIVNLEVENQVLWLNLFSCVLHLVDMDSFITKSTQFKGNYKRFAERIFTLVITAGKKQNDLEEDDIFHTEYN